MEVGREALCLKKGFVIGTNLEKYLVVKRIHAFCVLEREF
jgi:hypothetical protein